MAKLFTGHDPFNIHKIFGLLALIHFTYRFFAYPWRGYAFCSINNESCSEQDIRFDLLCIALHACLSWSSLLMPLPKKRNFTAPMIWKEHRWHSIIFSSRAIIASIFSILGLWPHHWAMNYASKVALTLGTCAAADYATKVYGSKVKRTTNAMAYPDYVTPAMQQKIKLNYSMAQMVATLSCTIEDPSLNFLSLYAIQGVAFLMTLRRKALISTRAVHLVYQLQLFAMYLPHAAALCHSQGKEYWANYFLLGGLYLLAGHLRIDRLHSKWFVWSTCIGIYQLFQCNQACWNVLLWFHTHPVGIAYVVFSHTNEYQRTFRHYAPIFAGRNLNEGKPAKAHPKQSLSRDLLESDMLAYPDRRQRAIMVFTAMFGTHFRGVEICREVVQTVMPGLWTAAA